MRVLTENETAEVLGISARTLARWRKDGGGPAWVRLGSVRIGYPLAALEKWVASRIVASGDVATGCQPDTAP